MTVDRDHHVSDGPDIDLSGPGSMLVTGLHKAMPDIVALVDERLPTVPPWTRFIGGVAGVLAFAAVLLVFGPIGVFVAGYLGGLYGVLLSAFVGDVIARARHRVRWTVALERGAARTGPGTWFLGGLILASGVYGSLLASMHDRVYLLIGPVLALVFCALLIPFFVSIEQDWAGLAVRRPEARIGV